MALYAYGSVYQHTMGPIALPPSVTLKVMSTDPVRSAAVSRGRQLEYLTVGWNVCLPVSFCPIGKDLRSQ